MSRTYDLAVDNVGPITTTFTGPSTCLQTTTLVGNEAYYVAAFWDDVPACYPPGTSTGFNFHTMPQYYSPALCPQGWAPVTSAGVDFPKTESDYDQWVVSPETNVWLCCPSGFTYWGFPSTAFYYTNDCQTTLNRGQHMTNLRISGSSSIDATVTILTTVRVDAKGIIIMWQSTDSAIVEWAKKATVAAAAAAASRSSALSTLGPAFTIGTESSSTSSSSNEKPSSTSSTLTSTPTLDSTTGGSSHSESSSSSSTSNTSSTTNLPAVNQLAATGGKGGLSTGAKAGIGVGVTFGVIALLFLGFWLGRRRTRRKDASISGAGHAAPGNKVGGAASSEMATHANTHEMSGRQVYELHDGRRYELSGDRN